MEPEYPRMAGLFFVPLKEERLFVMCCLPFFPSREPSGVEEEAPGMTIPMPTVSGIEEKRLPNDPSPSSGQA